MKGGIVGTKTILVFGAPCAGKTTWAREHLAFGLLYDLDLLAAALAGQGDFQSLPHPTHPDAREIADQLLLPIIQAARRCNTDLIIIRAAPTVEEISAISPSRVIWIRSDDAEIAMGKWTSSRLLPTVRIMEQMGYQVEEIQGR